MKNALFAAPFLVGSWFGMGQPDDKGSMWLIHMTGDGNFHAMFRSCSMGKNLDELETGRWRLSGDVESLHVQTVDGTSVSLDDDYKILSHDGGKQTYQFLRTGFVYSSRRVDDKFEMPSCETIS